jgi:hypothetical protein
LDVIGTKILRLLLSASQNYPHQLRVTLLSPCVFLVLKNSKAIAESVGLALVTLILCLPLKRKRPPQQDGDRRKRHSSSTRE